ncbi:nicotinate-nucleotide-dimethylbenzimidazole phosphoribosyltransferase [Colwellia chukchiensis]|uniref:Nicotinate-nucleotide--dimethylbenzimidazole phosphoribosyltransferase n=1 Tax=Colwellia chukchiensis TaxID=641665 RepID=A0A1H7NF64_9GAMM|nr:nicotinate-nucleotide--dimethylbenzimidazole phosphoribosyltransferase [Colwellia chukchiensis]SEL21547.1 nicotinate-nucleotide-dimethylbenzimidazole phosphoribosyltransferase [Colwellia chukchiensis]
MFNIESVSEQHSEKIQAIIDSKTKPLGALGELESLAMQLAKIQFSTADYSAANALAKSAVKLTLTAPHLTIFAGDHGVARAGVSIASSDVTRQMVNNFARGGGAINAISRQLGWRLSIVDAGILEPVVSTQVKDQRLGKTTHAINQHEAMSSTQVDLGFAFAKAHIDELHSKGCNLVAFGEMGIGNTTIASAIMAAVMGVPAAETVGRGTGISAQALIKKQQVIEQALALHQDKLTDPKSILRCLGGFEVVQLTAAMLAAAEHKMLIVVDGFICSAAAMLAIQTNANVKDYMVFAHCSGEQGHEKMLQWLDVKPLLNLGLRLGEGTGAALALPIIQAAVSFFNDMASFSDAEVTNVT